MRRGPIFLLILILILSVILSYFIAISYLDKQLFEVESEDEFVSQGDKDINTDNSDLEDNVYSDGTESGASSAVEGSSSEGIVDDGTCSDNDNGISINVQGKVTKTTDEILFYHDLCVVPLVDDSSGYYVMKNGVSYGAVSFCASSDCFIAEAYCHGNGVDFSVLDCVSGCNEGRCL